MTKVRECVRPGCGRQVNSAKSGLRFCSHICRATSYALADTEALCRALGPESAAVSELWSVAVSVADQLTGWHAQEDQLREIAQSVGITGDAFYALKRSEGTR